MSFIQRPQPRGVQQHGHSDRPRRQMLDEIGRDLRSAYADLARQPLPEHMMRLVRQLDQRDAGRR